MRKIGKLFGLLLYRAIAIHLPASHSRVGKLFLGGEFVAFAVN